MSSSQMSCPKNTMSGYFLASSVRCGMAIRQGTHQVAQKSITYTLPGSNFAIGSPLIHWLTTSGGAGSPTFRVTGWVEDAAVWAKALAAKAKTAAADRTEGKRITDSWV